MSSVEAAAEVEMNNASAEEIKLMLMSSSFDLPILTTMMSPTQHWILRGSPNLVTSPLSRAVDAAKQAYLAWSNTHVKSGQRLMLEYAHFLHKKEVMRDGEFFYDHG